MANSSFLTILFPFLCGRLADRENAGRATAKMPLATLPTVLVAQRLAQRRALVGGRERTRGGCKLDHLVRFLPARAGAACRERVHLRRRMMLNQKHAEQDEVRGLDVDDIRIERMRAIARSGAAPAGRSRRRTRSAPPARPAAIRTVRRSCRGIWPGRREGRPSYPSRSPRHRSCARPHSTLMLASRITCLHFAVSDLR